jgi:hypothetical protein
MKKIQKYTLDDGSTIGIELNDLTEKGNGQHSVNNTVLRGAKEPDDLPSEPTKFKQAIDKIPAITNALFATLQEINQPKEVELEMGLKLSAKTGIVIASANSDVHFKLKIKWDNG